MTYPAVRCIMYVMERPATIILRERATDDPVLVTQGCVERMGNSWNVRYNDGEAAYIVGISDGMVTVTREGEEDYTVVLCEGKEYSFDVETPYGSLTMTVIPKIVKSRADECGLSVRLAYELAAGGASRKFRLLLDCKFI